MPMERITKSRLAQSLDNAIRTSVGIRGLNTLIYGWLNLRHYGPKYRNAIYNRDWLYVSEVRTCPIMPDMTCSQGNDYPTNSENLILLRFAKAIICFYQIFAVSLHRLSVTAPTHLPLPLNSRRPQDEGKTKAKAN